MLGRILTGSRYLIIIAVLGSLLASVVVLIYDGLTVLRLIVEVFTHLLFTETEVKHIAIESIEVIDLFLIGTVLYIVALGLYELFIDESLPTPSWLVIKELDDLKVKILGVVVVLLAVTFLASAVNWNNSNTIAALGIAIGLIIAAIGYLIKQTFHDEHEEKHTDTDNT